MDDVVELFKRSVERRLEELRGKACRVYRKRYAERLSGVDVEAYAKLAALAALADDNELVQALGMVAGRFLGTDRQDLAALLVALLGICGGEEEAG